MDEINTNKEGGTGAQYYISSFVYILVEARKNNLDIFYIKKINVSFKTLKIKL